MTVKWYTICTAINIKLFSKNCPVPPLKEILLTLTLNTLYHIVMVLRRCCCSSPSIQPQTHTKMEQINFIVSTMTPYTLWSFTCHRITLVEDYSLLDTFENFPVVKLPCLWFQWHSDHIWRSPVCNVTLCIM